MEKEKENRKTQERREGGGSTGKLSLEKKEKKVEGEGKRNSEGEMRSREGENVERVERQKGRKMKGRDKRKK